MESMRTKVLARAQGGYALEDLLVRIASADEDALRLLYDRTAGRLFAVCLRIARHRRLAEELLQESYVRIWQRAREFDPTRGGALVWMIAIARKHALDVIRLRMRQDRPPDELTLEAADAAEPPADLFGRIKSAIAAEAADLPGTITVRAGEGGWQTIARGVERKVLYRTEERVTYLIRGQRGARLPGHAHDDDEEIYVLQGDL